MKARNILMWLATAITALFFLQLFGGYKSGKALASLEDKAKVTKERQLGNSETQD